MAEVCLAQLCRSGVSAPLLPVLVTIKASKRHGVDAVIRVIVQRKSLISTSKRNLLLAFAGFAELGLSIHLLVHVFQCSQCSPNSNRKTKEI